MKKMIFLTFLVLCLLSLNVFASKFKITHRLSAYSKEIDLLTVGLGMEIFFGKNDGFYMDYIYSATVHSEYSDIKTPTIYKGFHFSAGMRFRWRLSRPSQISGFYLYANGGVRHIRGYTETLKTKTNAQVSCLTTGGGLIFWYKENGLQLEVMKDFSVKAEGFRVDKNVFSGIRFVLTGVRIWEK